MKIAAVILVLMFVLAALVLTGAESTSGRFSFVIDDFSGGMDLNSPVVSLDNHHFLDMTNFLVRGSHLEVRPGLANFARSTPFSERPIVFLDVYQTTNSREIVASDGRNVWIGGNDSASFNEPLTISLTYDTGTIYGAEDDTVLYGSSDCQWRSIYGVGGGQKITIEDTAEYYVDYFDTDTSVYIRTGLRNDFIDVDYSIGNLLTAVNDGINYDNKYLLATDVGLLEYDGTGVTGEATIDSILRFQYDSAVYRNWDTAVTLREYKTNSTDTDVRIFKYDMTINVNDLTDGRYAHDDSTIFQLIGPDTIADAIGSGEERAALFVFPDIIAERADSGDHVDSAFFYVWLRAVSGHANGDVCCWTVKKDMDTLQYYPNWRYRQDGFWWIVDVSDTGWKNSINIGRTTNDSIQITSTNWSLVKFDMTTDFNSYTSGINPERLQGFAVGMSFEDTVAWAEMASGGAKSPFLRVYTHSGAYPKETDYFVNDSNAGGGDPDSLTFSDYIGYYMDIVTGPYLADGTGSDTAAESGHYFRCIQRIDRVDTPLVFTVGNAMMKPDEGEFIVISQRSRYNPSSITLTYDTTDEVKLKFMVVDKDGDSIQAVTRFCVDTNLISDSLGQEWDSTTFRTGDWVLGVAGPNGHPIPIVGGVPPDTLDSCLCFLTLPYKRYALSEGGGLDTQYFNMQSVEFYRMVKESRSTPEAEEIELVDRFQNRLFYKKSSEPNHLFWSEVNDPDSTRATSELICQTWDGDEISQIQHQGDRLVAYMGFSKLRIYSLNTYFTNEENAITYTFEQVSTRSGLIAPNTLVDIDGNHFGLGTDGFWGPDFQILSQPLEKWIEDSVDMDQIDGACAAYYDGDIWLSLPMKGGAGNQVTFTYNLATQAWTRHSFGASAFIASLDADDSAGFYIADADTGKLYFLHGTKDDGEDIRASIKTGFYDFNLPEYYKVSRGLMMSYYMPDDCDAALRVYRDFGVSPVWADTFNSTSNQGVYEVYCPDSIYGKNMAIGAHFENADSVRIPWLRWWVRKGGRCEY